MYEDTNDTYLVHVQMHALVRECWSEEREWMDGGGVSLSEEGGGERRWRS
jgi:hypothetical protein